MAKTFLDAGDTFTFSESNNIVFGSRGSETVKVAAGVTNLIVDANVEQVQLTSSLANYKFKQSGNVLQVYSSANALIASVGVQDDADGTLLAFSDNTVKATFVASATGFGFAVNGQIISASTPTAMTTSAPVSIITPVPTTPITLITSTQNFEAKAPFVYQTNNVNQLDSVTTLLTYSPSVTNGVDYSTFETEQWRIRASDAKLAFDLTQTDNTTNRVVFQGNLEAFSQAQTWYKIHLTETSSLNVQDLSKNADVIEAALFTSDGSNGVTYFKSIFDASGQLNSYQNLPAGDYLLRIDKGAVSSTDARLNQAADFNVLLNTEPSDDFILPALQFNATTSTIHAELAAQQTDVYYKFTLDNTTKFTLDTTNFANQFDIKFWKPELNGSLLSVNYTYFLNKQTSHIYEMSAGTYYLNVSAISPFSVLKTLDIPITATSISFNTTFTSTAPSSLKADIEHPKTPFQHDADGNLVLTYSFDLSKIADPADASPNPTKFSDAQQIAARLAFQEYANIAKLKFVEVLSGSSEKADITFTNVSNLGVPAADTSASLSWMNDFVNALIRVDLSDESNLDVSVGSHGYSTILHEMGHALGLKHPQQYVGGGVSDAPYLIDAKDNEQYTLMSYNDYLNKTPDGTDLNANSGAVSEKTPMLYDVAAIQSLYGANTGYNVSDTVYRWDTNTNPRMTIWDGGGVDTIDASNQTQMQILDLRAGQFSSIGAATLMYSDNSMELYPAKDNLSIAYDTVIEKAAGGSADDTLIGNSVANQLTGNAGSDNFVFSSTLSAFNVDVITDFSTEDKLTLNRAVFSGLNSGNSLTTDKILVGNTTTAAENTLQRIIFNVLNHSLFYDSDGLGGAAPIEFAILSNVTQLNANQIFIQG